MPYIKNVNKKRVKNKSENNNSAYCVRNFKLVLDFRNTPSFLRLFAAAFHDAHVIPGSRDSSSGRMRLGIRPESGSAAVEVRDHFRRLPFGALQGGRMSFQGTMDMFLILQVSLVFNALLFRRNWCRMDDVGATRKTARMWRATRLHLAYLSAPRRATCSLKTICHLAALATLLLGGLMEKTSDLIKCIYRERFFQQADFGYISDKIPSHDICISTHKVLVAFMNVPCRLCVSLVKK